MHSECTLHLFDSVRLDDSEISLYITLLPYETIVVDCHL